jgi:drug/metabolite transporter (DMT)-like permease
MPPVRVYLLTALAMVAFAANALLSRLAFTQTGIDAASFTTIRLASGGAALLLILRLRGTARGATGTWPSAFALFVFVAAFSYAYLSVSAAVGTLVMCGAIEVTMILAGLWAGERMRLRQGIGFTLALAGLVILVLTGLSAPPLGGTLLILTAGVAWGVYSLQGRGGADPFAATAGNFLRAACLSVALSLATLPWARADGPGLGYAILAGVFASGIGYALWYSALPWLSSTRAATVQLSVPVLAAFGGIVFLSEPITPRLLVASCAILGGSALVVRDSPRAVPLE